MSIAYHTPRTTYLPERTASGDCESEFKLANGSMSGQQSLDQQLYAIPDIVLRKEVLSMQVRVQLCHYGG